MKFNAFHIGETGQMLSKYMDGNQSTCMIVNSKLRYLSTKSQKLSFQECWPVCVITENSLTISTTNLKWHTNLVFNPDSLPVSTSINFTLLPPTPLPLLLLPPCSICWHCESTSTADESHSVGQKLQFLVYSF